MTCTRTSYDSILLIVGLHDQPVQIQLPATKTQSPPPSLDPPGIAFELDCGYHLRVSYNDINPRPDYLHNKQYINPFPPGHGFGHYPGGWVETSMINLFPPDLVRFRA